MGLWVWHKKVTNKSWREAGDIHGDYNFFTEQSDLWYLLITSMKATCRVGHCHGKFEFDIY